MYYNTTISTDSSNRIGFVGLGKMGEPMARRLAAAGEQVAAFDPAPDAARRLADVEGVSLRESAADCAAEAGLVILMLPTSAVVASVLRGGLLDCLAPGAMVIDMGSSEPAATRALAAEAAAVGVRLIDAPVSGGTAGAEAGTLTIMVGGAEEDFAAAQRPLATLGKKILHVGPAGAGHALKSLNNLLSATSLLASCEAVAIGERFGLDSAVMVDALNGSTGRSGSTEVKLPKFVLNGAFDSGFAYDLMVKDMRIALDLATSLDLPTELGSRALELWEKARPTLPEAADHTEIGRWLGLPPD